MNGITGVASKPKVVIFEKGPSVALDCSHSLLAFDDEECLVKIRVLCFFCRDVKHRVKDNLLFRYLVNSGNVAVVEGGDFYFRFIICESLEKATQDSWNGFVGGCDGCFKNSCVVKSIDVRGSKSFRIG